MDGTRLDRVNENLILRQKTDGLVFGTDALLLAAYVRGAERGRALELGTGTGIVSLLLAVRHKVARVTAVEIQRDYADLARENVRENGLADTVEVLLGDVRDPATCGEGDYDLVVTNPPYMKTDIPSCDNPEKQIARHEVMGGIGDFVSCAAKKLRFGGRFFCVYRPERLPDLFFTMRENGIEPKRMTLVTATSETPPSVVLVEGKRGGKPSLTVTKTLVIGADPDGRADSPDMCHILENGVFPKDYD